MPGGWRGPIEVAFVDVEPTFYAITVHCEEGWEPEYDQTYYHLSGEGRDSFSTEIPPLPRFVPCFVNVNEESRPDWPDSFWSFSTSGWNLHLRTYSAPERFFPRVRDGYFDRIRLEYELTQPADVTARIVNNDGKAVVTLHARHRVSGTKAFIWDGRNSRGVVVREGRYRIVMVATNRWSEPARATNRFTVSDLLDVRPGAIGTARVGMTVKQAMATGKFNRNVRKVVPGVCETVYPLLPKPPMTWDYSPFLERGRIVEVTAHTRAVKLPRGLTYPPTAAQVRRAYGGAAISGTAGYGNNTLFVRQRQRWLAFVFNSYSYDRGLRPKDRAKYFSVAVGRRPGGWTHDGC